MKYLILFWVAFSLAIARQSSGRQPGVYIEETPQQIKDTLIDRFELNRPTVVVMGLDSLETEQLKKDRGKDFYPLADDAIWYDAEMQTKLDSLNIPVKNTNRDKVQIVTSKKQFTIKKDTTQLFTYFWFDGTHPVEKDVFQLLYDDVEGHVNFEQ